MSKEVAFIKLKGDAISFVNMSRLSTMDDTVSTSTQENCRGDTGLFSRNFSVLEETSQYKYP